VGPITNLPQLHVGATAQMEKFSTCRLVARSWQAEDLPFAMELWGDPAVTALIDSRGQPKRRSGNDSTPRSSEKGPMAFSIGRCLLTAMASSSAAAGCGLGSIRPARRISSWGFTSSGPVGATVSELKPPVARSDMHGKICSCRRYMPAITRIIVPQRGILRKVGFEFIDTVFYEPTGLMHPSYV